MHDYKVVGVNVGHIPAGLAGDIGVRPDERLVTLPRSL